MSITADLYRIYTAINEDHTDRTEHDFMSPGEDCAVCKALVKLQKFIEEGYVPEDES